MKILLKCAAVLTINLAILAMPLQVAAQQPYPIKAIRLLVGTAPGGAGDQYARMMAEWIQESLGQSAVVDNRPVVASDVVARSTPDGYTLLVTPETFITVPLIMSASYDPFKDFAPIGTIALSRYVMVAYPSAPFSTVKELIAYAKANPGKLNFGSSGNGASSHIGFEKFKMLTGTDIAHIPYKGAGPAVIDLIAGRHDLGLWVPLTVAPHVAAGKLKALAVTGPKRLQAMPDIPSFAEAGLPGYDHNTWQGVLAPAGTPKAIVDRLNGEIHKMVASPKIKTRLDAGGVEALLSTPEQFATMMRTQSADLAKLVKIAKIKIE